MRLLSRALAGSPLRGGASQVPERRAPRPAPVLDDDVLDLLQRLVNSPVKLDLVLYLHENPYAIDGTDALALRLGREAPLVEACAAELAVDGVLVLAEQRPGGRASVYRLAPDPTLSGRIARLATVHGRDGAARVRAAVRDVGAAQAVRAAIAGSTRVSAQAITVRCSDGAVTVEGRVNTPAERAELDGICERFREARQGVRGVENQVAVDPRGLPEDVGTRDAVARALEEYTHRGAGRLRIGVEVTGGVVYLTGLAASAQDRASAARHVLGVPGVVDVVNWIDVQGQRSR